jgi:hypothetical protein
MNAQANKSSADSELITITLPRSDWDSIERKLRAIGAIRLANRLVDDELSKSFAKFARVPWPLEDESSSDTGLSK